MHPVLGNVVGSYWLESACAYMQCYIGNIDALVLQPRQHCCIKMQAGSWRSDGARLSGINCLVTFLVIGASRVLDIGRQR